MTSEGRRYMNSDILDPHPISMLQHSGYFVAHPGTSVHHGNQQEVTGDKQMLTNLMSDGNYPNYSDFYGLSFLFLELFYYSAAERC